jgi:hypothetical protein
MSGQGHSVRLLALPGLDLGSKAGETSGMNPQLPSAARQVPAVRRLFCRARRIRHVTLFVLVNEVIPPHGALLVAKCADARNALLGMVLCVLARHLRGNAKPYTQSMDTEETTSDGAVSFSVMHGNHFAWGMVPNGTTSVNITESDGGTTAVPVTNDTFAASWPTAPTQVSFTNTSGSGVPTEVTLPAQ